MPDLPHERFYIQPCFDGEWELWERQVDGEHTLLATFHDGDKQHSPLAEMVLSFLNAVAEVGAQTKEREQKP